MNVATEKSTQDFVWTDELVSEFHKTYGHRIFVLEKDFNQVIEKFKQSHLPKIYPEGILSVKHMGMTDGDRLKEFEIESSHHTQGKYYQTWCRNRLDDGGCVIWSVNNGKEILTVGDTVHSKNYPTFKWAIGKFSIKYEGKLFAASADDLASCEISLLVRAIPEKQPLFYSDDNQPVFDKEKIYSVFKLYDKVYCSPVVTDEAEFKARGKVPGAKYFVRYGNAKTYITSEYPKHTDVTSNLITEGSYIEVFALPKEYTEADMRACFDAGRMLSKGEEDHHWHEYDNFDDYINS